MKDIFKYSAAVSRQNNRSPELAALLPKIIAAKLENIAARAVTASGSVVSFHGRASRSVPRSKRFVTNWNLLHIIARGAMRVTDNFPEISVSYWLGIPKALFYQTAILSGVMGVGIGIFSFIARPSIGFSLLLALGIALGSLLFFLIAFMLYFMLTIVRFNLFIRYCMNAAEKQLRQ